MPVRILVKGLSFCRKNLHEPNHIQNPERYSRVRKKYIGKSMLYPLLTFTGNIITLLRRKQTIRGT